MASSYKYYMITQKNTIAVHNMDEANKPDSNMFMWLHLHKVQSQESKSTTIPAGDPKETPPALPQAVRVTKDLIPILALPLTVSGKLPNFSKPRLCQ